MSGQERAQRSHGSTQEELSQVPTPSTTAAHDNADVDSLLDEIDDVLETNAESFVRGFVQKGGQ